MCYTPYTLSFMVYSTYEAAHGDMAVIVAKAATSRYSTIDSDAL